MPIIGGIIGIAFNAGQMSEIVENADIFCEK